MNLTSFLANKCFELLLNLDSAKEKEEARPPFHPIKNIPPKNSFFPPPWSRNAKLFKSLCNGCGDCLDACENRILKLGKDGYPHVDFSGGWCSFCGACARICTRGALVYENSSAPWNLKAAVTGDCLMKNRVLCSSCAGRCDKGAIVLSPAIQTNQTPRVLPAKCDGCGSCSGACPVGAITFNIIPESAMAREVKS